MIYDNDKPYEKYPQGVRICRKVDTKVALMVEGYAMACEDLMEILTGSSPSNRESYDPMEIDCKRLEAWSSTFKLKGDGSLSLYDDVGDLMSHILNQTVDWVNNNR